MTPAAQIICQGCFLSQRQAVPGPVPPYLTSLFARPAKSSQGTSLFLIYVLSAWPGLRRSKKRIKRNNNKSFAFVGVEEIQPPLLFSPYSVI